MVLLFSSGSFHPFCSLPIVGIFVNFSFSMVNLVLNFTKSGSGFWPTLAVFLQRIPALGWIMQQPFVTSVS
jgi:hypothetical protein